MDWSDGYFSELGYTPVYCREINPAMLRVACLANAISVPRSEDLAYLELGFGQGVSLNMHAAASPGHFRGVDFTPAHVSHARKLAEASGGAPGLDEGSFGEFARRPDLPQFDIIALHGVWSWVSLENQEYIKEIVRRALKPGGIVYISYNCAVGMSSQTPLRHFLMQHLATSGTAFASVEERISSALDFARQLAVSDIGFFAANPTAAEELEKLASKPVEYIAHEYLNESWHTHHFADVSRSMSEAKLDYATSANLLDHLADYGMPPPVREILGRVKDEGLFHTVLDLMLNRKFRRDIFVKGPVKLEGLEIRDAWFEIAFCLTVPSTNIRPEHATPAGNISLDTEVYGALLDYLGSGAGEPKSVREVAGEFEGMIDTREIISAMLVLAGLGYIQPALNPGQVQIEQCHALNLHLCKGTLSGGGIRTLASPVLGGGIAASKEQQFAVLAALEGARSPEQQARYLNDLFDGSSSQLTMDGQVISAGQHSYDYFRRIAEEFETSGCAKMFRSLKVIPEGSCRMPETVSSE